MKILFDYQAFLMQNYGGVSRYYYELLTNMSESVKSKVACKFSDNEYLLQLKIAYIKNITEEQNKKFASMENITEEQNKKFTSMENIIKMQNEKLASVEKITKKLVSIEDENELLTTYGIFTTVALCPFLVLTGAFINNVFSSRLS